MTHARWQTWIVGGAVRDRLLGLPVQDRDWVVTGATPEDLLAAGFKPVGKDFPVFLHPQTHEEYALARTERKSGSGYRGFVVHTPPGNWQSSLLVNDDIAMTTSRDIIEQLGKAAEVDKAIVSIGYSNWGAGQLEGELAENSWLTVAADEHILFELPYGERYEAAFAKLGIRPEILMEGAGHA